MNAHFPPPVLAGANVATMFRDLVLPDLRRRFGPEQFEAWFKRLDIDSVVGNEARLTQPNAFLRSWMQKFEPRILASLQVAFPRVETVSFGIRTQAARPPAPTAPEPPKVQPLTDPIAPAPHLTPDVFLVGSPLDRRLDFGSFVVGRSNQLAHIAVTRVVTAQPGEMVFNPLYVFGQVGVGKTHLLQATAHSVSSAGRRAFYCTAERFMYGVAGTLRSQPTMSYRQALRSFDVFLIDDLQFLQGKAVRQDVANALNVLIESGVQVVVAADRPPSELEGQDERVRSRLSAGLSVEISPPDEVIRLEILRARVAKVRASVQDFDVPDVVLAFVASVITADGRDLEGALNRLVARWSLNRETITVEGAECAIRDLIRVRAPRRIKIDDIQRLVAQHYGVRREDIMSDRRTANVVRPRQVAMYLSKVLTPRSLPDIGRRFGGRDHTTVLHAVKKIERLSGEDAVIREEVQLIRSMLEDAA